MQKPLIHVLTLNYISYPRTWIGKSVKLIWIADDAPDLAGVADETKKGMKMRSREWKRLIPVTVTPFGGK